jgi:hypothetical protein
MTASPAVDDMLPPWMKPLSPESREAVRRNVEQAPPLTARQRERLRLLFRSTARESAGVA